jgi:hypothetical protein
MIRVKGGLIRFYREIAGMGLVFPRADRPIAVEFPGYPVVTLRPIEGLEFVKEAVAAVRSSGESHPPSVSGVLGGRNGQGQYGCRVGPGNFTPSLSQIRT